MRSPFSWQKRPLPSDPSDQGKGDKWQNPHVNPGILGQRGHMLTCWGPGTRICRSARAVRYALGATEKKWHIQAKTKADCPPCLPQTLTKREQPKLQFPQMMEIFTETEGSGMNSLMLCVCEVAPNILLHLSVGPSGWGLETREG